MIVIVRLALFYWILQLPSLQFDKIEKLLCLAKNYNQVEKSVMLLPCNSTLITKVPCISPLRAEDLRYISVSSSYGTRLHPILNEYKHHSGIDLRGTEGEKVYASADGLVAAASEERLIGNYIKLKHAFGFTTVYGHLSSFCVSIGDSIRIGQIIGFVGSTGRSTGPHLHYGITKNNLQQDPLPYCYLYMKWLERNTPPH